MNKLRWLLVMIGVAAMVATTQPAQAAAMNGSVRAGRGVSGCEQAASCLVFRQNCGIPPQGNDVDASVRAVPASILGLAKPVRWQESTALTTSIVVEVYNANCVRLMNPTFAADGTITLPTTAKWVAVLGSGPHAGFTWTIG